jgi:hypothetical protein
LRVPPLVGTAFTAVAYSYSPVLFRFVDPEPLIPSPYWELLEELMAASCICMMRTISPVAMAVLEPVAVPKVIEVDPAAAVEVPG